MRPRDEAPSAGIVFAAGMLVGAILTCVAVAATLPQVLA